MDWSKPPTCWAGPPAGPCQNIQWLLPCSSTFSGSPLPEGQCQQSQHLRPFSIQLSQAYQLPLLPSHIPFPHSSMSLQTSPFPSELLCILQDPTHTSPFSHPSGSLGGWEGLVTALALGRWVSMCEGERTLASGLGSPAPTAVLLSQPRHKSTDRRRTKERRRGGRLERLRSRPRGRGATRLCPAHAQHVGAAWPGPGPTCRTSLGRRCSHPSGCGLCKERSRGSVWPPGLGMGTAGRVCGTPCVCPGAPASRELGWLRAPSTGRRLPPGQACGAGASSWPHQTEESEAQN